MNKLLTTIFNNFHFISEIKILENKAEKIYEKFEEIKLDRPILLAIDGVVCSGKTTFARKLVDYLRLNGENVIQAAFDYYNINFLFNFAYIKSASPYYDGEDSPNPNSSFSFEETKHIHDFYAKNPDNVSFGRRIFLGLNYNF